MNFSNFDFQYIFFGIVSFIIAGSLHEYAHAFTAYILGDDTARISGRMTLNPLAHIDVWGSIIFPLSGAIFGAPVIGWMKPVPVNPLRFRKQSRDDAICALAGPFSNLLQASFIIIIIKLFQMTVSAFGISSNIIIDTIENFLVVFFSTNICLMVFNLFPVPPLDGGWILRHFLPDDWKDRFDFLYRYGFIILFILVAAGIFSSIFNPLVETTISMFATLFRTNIFLLVLPFARLMGTTIFFLREEVQLFIHRVQHRSILNILSGKKEEESPAFEETNEKATLYDEQAEEYIKESKARNVWKTCDGTVFDRQTKSCIKCDKYVKCLTQMLHNTSST